MKKIKESGCGAISDLEMRNPRTKAMYWLMYAFVILLVVVTLLPILWTLLSAFKDTEEYLRMPPTIIPETFHWDKLITVWQRTDFLVSYISTLIITLGDIAFSVIFNGLAGYVISRLKPRGTKWLGMIILWTMMMPNGISTVPLFMSFVETPLLGLNLTNTYLPFWMMAGANAFNILLFKSFFDSISMSYLEAARVDGCTDFSIFWKIIMPMSKPVIFTVAIFSFTASWGSFFWPSLLLTDQALAPVGLKIFNLKLILKQDEYMTALIYVILPPSIMFMIFQENIMKGFTVGGIKG